MAADELTLPMAATGGAALVFEDVLRRHEAQVLRTALRMLGRMEDAQDAAQEVWVRLFRNWKKVDGARGLEPLLYRMTMNACFDVLRKQRPEHGMTDEPVSAAVQHTDLEAEERKERLRKALLLLPEKERAALVLRDIEGLETWEVAEALGSSETTVRSQVSMGRARLRKILTGGEV